MRVLMATDGSEHAEEAVGFLARLPHDEPLELTIIAVTPVLEFHGSIDVLEWMKRNAEAEKGRALQNCQKAARAFEGANAKVDILVVEGHPGEQIVEQAEALDADLIVVGSLGMNLVARMMLGSVSDFVVTHAPCSVLVVRPTGDAQGKHRDLNLCLADDESLPAKFAMQQLGSFAWGAHTKLDLVNVMISPVTYTDVPVVVDTGALRSDILETLGKRAEGLKHLSPRVNTHVIEAAHVGDGVVGFAKKHATDLIILGHTGRGLLARFLLGSVSRYVLRNAPCSVWIARRKRSDRSVAQA